MSGDSMVINNQQWKGSHYGGWGEPEPAERDQS